MTETDHPEIVLDFETKRVLIGDQAQGFTAEATRATVGGTPRRVTQSRTERAMTVGRRARSVTVGVVTYVKARITSPKVRHP